jgi:formylmethanofuran dehydrogenase subunit A
VITHLIGCQAYDASQGWDGTPRDLWIQDDQFIDPPGDGARVDYRVDLTGHIAMAGAIDLHTHIGGGKANIARLLLPELMAGKSGPWTGNTLRDPLLTERVDHFLPPAPMVGRRYLEMGYTACFEPAMIACNARGTHAELADTPGIDTGAYVVLGNEDMLLAMVRDRVDQQKINDYVAAMVLATRALGVKVVNPGGINAFKFNVRSLDVDVPHPIYGVTPGQMIRVLSRAVDEIGLAQPLHVHASNLGVAGNIESTLKTIEAADGHRIHLTHVQFHSYGKSGSQGFSSGAEQIARAIETHPNLTIDVGQIMFGQTVTISADSMHQFASRKIAKPRKSVIVDIECQAGCGVVPFRYENKRFVNALQWSIGLELFLMVNDPSRVFLTTDHPNGGPFTSYPHLIRLLMDRSFRETALAEIHPDAAAASQLAGMDREYSVAEIAEMTRLAPANFLGLQRMGRLATGCVADLAVYKFSNNWERTFAAPTHVYRRGRLVVRNGRLFDLAPKVTHRANPVCASSIDLGETIPISDDEMFDQIKVRCESQGN